MTEISLQRRKEQKGQQFVAGDVQGVMATTAFGQGIDVGGVRVVIHNEVLFNVIEYQQQSGHAGRDGRLAYSFIFVNEQKQPIIPTPDLLGISSLVDMIWSNSKCQQIALTVFMDGPGLTKLFACRGYSM